jgi:hypothetical protein
MYRIDAFLNERFSFVGSSRLIALVHLSIYWMFFAAISAFTTSFFPHSPASKWLATNWPWLPLPIEFAYLLYCLCRNVLEVRTSSSARD